MSRRAAWPVALLLICGGAGCAGPDSELQPLAVGELGYFREHIQPMLELRCAQGGCHGRPERPLSLYARGAQRINPEHLHLDEPINEVELEHNALRLAAFSHMGPTPDAPTLCKPLAQSGGGCFHAGGDVFLDVEDADYLTLSHWLSGETGTDGGLP